MQALAAHFKEVLLVGGLMTSSMWLAAVAPRTGIRLLLGEAPADGLPILLSRMFGLMVGMNGLMLIWAAFHPEVRPVVLIYAIAGKTAFVILTASGPWRRMAAVGLVADSVLVALFAAGLLTG